MSERIRAMMTCVSGSPKRELNSSTFGPASVIISPANSTPWKRRPSAARPAIVGRMTSCMIRLWPSRLRWWSATRCPCRPCSGRRRRRARACGPARKPSARTREPSEKTRNETSSPSRNSSITIFAPAEPNLPPISSSTAARASAASRATTAPLPAARPSALTTSGKPNGARFTTVQALVERGADLVARRGDAVARHELARERLGALDLGGAARGREDAQPAAHELVADAEHHRQLGADDREVGLDRLGEVGDLDDVGGVDRHAVGEVGHPGVAWGAVHLADERALADLPGERVLPAHRCRRSAPSCAGENDTAGARVSTRIQKSA